MPARKLKPAEANDGSYAGLVLAAWDRLEEQETSMINLKSSDGLTREERFLADETLAPVITTVVERKGDVMGSTYCYWTAAPFANEADRRRHISYHNHRHHVRKQVLLLRSYYNSSNWDHPEFHDWMVRQAGVVEDEIARLWKSRPKYLLSDRAMAVAEQRYDVAAE